MRKSSTKKKFRFVFSKVFSNPLYAAFAASAALNMLFIDYFILLESTTLSVFWQSNNMFYDITASVSTILISGVFGIAAAMFAYQWRGKQKRRSSSAHGILGGAFGVISAGCPVCGAWLISALGIAGGLAAFPFQGLEIKALALIFLGWSVYASTQAIYNQKKGVCPPPPKGLSAYAPYIAGIAAIVFLLALPVFASKYDIRFSFRKKEQRSASEQNKNAAASPSFNISSVLPEKGYSLGISYGNIGPKMLEAGVIDFEKFKEAYKRAGRPLTARQIKILKEGSDEKIRITKDNSYFLLNFLWALGLANSNPILEEGPLMKYRGLSGVGGFASTGGWTLGKSKATDYYSRYSIVPLTSRQQGRLEDFAYHSYRPCCNNSTAFADCNHGMAALGLGEILAASGASADEMFQSQKFFNAFWFPRQYVDIAKYFQAKEGKKWDAVDARIVMGKDYSTAGGWSRVRRWLKENNALERAPSSGGGCGI